MRSRQRQPLAKDRRRYSRKARKPAKMRVAITVQSVTRLCICCCVLFAAIHIIAAAAASSSPERQHQKQEQREHWVTTQLQFDVVVAQPGPLGVQLNADLSIRAITPAARSLNEQHGVRAGDRIVALNGAPVPPNLGLSAFQQLLADTPRPLYLTVQPSDDQPRYSVASGPPSKAEATMINAATVRLVEIVTNTVLLSVPATDAEFSTRSFCRPRPLFIASPFDGCGHFGRNLTGNYVLVERGGCTFFHKALNAELAGAQGLIIVNSENSTFRMASPDRRSVNMSVVMIGKQSGDRLRQALEQQDGPVRVALHVSRHCWDQDGKWVHNSEVSYEVVEQTSQGEVAEAQPSSLQQPVSQQPKPRHAWSRTIQPHITHQGIRWFAPNGTEIPYQYVAQLEKELADQNRDRAND